MIKRYLSVLVCLPIFWIQAQEINYLGGEPNDDIIVTSSSDYFRSGWNEIASADKTINGVGLDAKRMAASRFLAQATLGADMRSINALAEESDYEKWIDVQAEIPANLYLEDTARNLWRCL